MKPSQLRALLKGQDICYRVPGTRWDEALPMGDGCFGAMAYQEGDALAWTFNHYDIYLDFNTNDFPNPPFDREAVTCQAQAAYDKANGGEVESYTRTLYPSSFETYGWLRRGQWMNIAGRLQLHCKYSLDDAIEFEQRLNLHDATVETRCVWREGEVLTRSYIAKNSGAFVLEVECSTPGLIERIGLHRLPSPRSTAPQSKTHQKDFWVADILKSGEEQLEYSLYGRVVDESGAEWNLKPRRLETAMEFASAPNAQRFTILMAAATNADGQDAVDAAREIINRAQERGASELQKTHRQYWRGFWNKSQIELSDKFVEKLWYINLYTFACANGEGMKWKSQACGLNGLWDIKNPNGWGSSWYWDVNIQQAYWFCYTANHLELAQPFYDGLCEYLPAARRWASEFYQMRGIAGDFPFPFYHCIWPWCCQFLWWGYRYSGDEAFLKTIAYPIMREVLWFFEDFLQRDENGKYFAFPSVSPEQGPFGKNPTILLSSLKYLLQAAIEASRILKLDAENRKTWQHILENLSPYPVGESTQFGRAWKDSDWASPTLYLAHSSVLMAIYPTGEIAPDSPREEWEIARNTLRYADTLQSHGTHNAAWMPSAAARLGLGDEALRMFMERGVAELLRPNGLCAEQSERHIENCHVLSDPLYLPPMAECMGGVVGSVNEMLLQSRDGKIRLFPAIPSSWPEARFTNLLAEGAFEVSGEYSRGKTSWYQIKARRGGECHLVFNGKSTRLVLQVGEMVEKRIIQEKLKPKSASEEIPCYVAPSSRRMFIGKNAHTEYCRALDDFLYDYKLGDFPVPRATKYKFDFGPSPAAPKDYASVMKQQLFNRNKIGADFYRIHPNTEYSTLQRFGWKNPRNLIASDNEKPDALRRDFIAGNSPASFCLELPRGQYQLLFLFGDEHEETQIGIEVKDQFRWQSRVLQAGQFAVEVFPVRMKDDGVLEIRLSGRKAHGWKLNALMLNQIP